MFSNNLTMMTDLYELKAAILAARENCDLPVFTSMSFESRGRTFTGCTVESYAVTAAGLGADAVGMSTVPEAIAAAHCGYEILGVTLCANMAAGVLPQPLSGEEVNEMAEQSAPHFSSLILGCLERL